MSISHIAELANRNGLLKRGTRPDSSNGGLHSGRASGASLGSGMGLESEEIEDFGQCLVHFVKLGMGQLGERTFDKSMIVDRTKLIDQKIGVFCESSTGRHTNA